MSAISDYIDEHFSEPLDALTRKSVRVSRVLLASSLEVASGVRCGG